MPSPRLELGLAGSQPTVLTPILTRLVEVTGNVGCIYTVMERWSKWKKDKKKKEKREKKDKKKRITKSQKSSPDGS